MTKTELHNKHPLLLKPEGIALISDLATHLLKGTPILAPNVAIDQNTSVRRSGWLDGWIAVASCLSVLHLPEQQQQQQPAKERPYSQPPGPVIVPKEEVKS